MCLADIAGQEHAVAVLKRALRSGRLAHAYLFEGPPGAGKRPTALGLGLALACPEAPREGCGACEICRRIQAANHPDVLMFDASQLQELAKASGEKSAVKYAARYLFPYAMQAPHEAGARLLVIDHADELSPEVQNTLLKTLEEPRAGVHIVLLTSAPDRLLPTIVSRTQRVRFSALPVVRDGGTAAWPELDQLRRGAALPDAADLFDAAAALGDKESKQRLPAVLGLLAAFYRDVLTAALGAPQLVVLRERGPEIERLGALAAGGGGVLRLRRVLQAVVEADEALKGNVNAVAALEHLLFEMRACESRWGAPPAQSG